MISSDLKFDEIPYMYDQVGRICVKGEKVYRIIENEEHIDNYKELLTSDYIEELFSIGLVRTTIVEELESKGVIVLEHKKIPFILNPCEYTDQMFWQAAYMFVQLNLKLNQLGFLTHDAHSWNISFDGNRPVFFDFGSIMKKKDISCAWFNEFFKCFIVPVFLANFSKKTYKYSKEYRREHNGGFGQRIFNSTKVKKVLFSKVFSFLKYKDNPERLLKELLYWLDSHKPLAVTPDYWSGYYKNEELDFLNPKTLKQSFVFDILKKESPKKVADLASNKGYYAYMAANFGANVVAFDYEEEIVNSIVQKSKFPMNVTPVHMDFNRITPALGVSLFWKDSYYRFRSDIVLALGLIHHICITQGVPVFLFCESCKKFATKGVVLEFVEPSDIHVSKWNKEVPKDYSFEKVKYFMSDKFPKCDVSEKILDGGLNRIIMYFHK